jgi:hypothetical protein
VDASIEDKKTVDISIEENLPEHLKNCDEMTLNDIRCRMLILEIERAHWNTPFVRYLQVANDTVINGAENVIPRDILMSFEKRK